MKSKTKQYLLLSLVILIWGVIIVRFFWYSDSGNSSIPPIQVTNVNTSTSVNKLEYSYHLNYSDPFLKFTAYEIRQEKTPEQRPPRPASVIPEVAFVGVVSSGRKMTGILRIEGRSLMVSEGDEISDFTIGRIEEKSMQLHYIPVDSTVVLKPSEKSMRREFTSMN